MALMGPEGDVLALPSVVATGASREPDRSPSS